MPWDDNLNQEKKDIILDRARIKVVRAGPGTGKTRLFVGTLRREMEGWNHKKAGIAALSFTNVAQQEFSKRVGSIPTPHLATTIDSFILRFIIRPFAHLITKNNKGTRLLPAIIAEHHPEDDIQIGTHRAERSKLTDISYIGHDRNGNVLMKGITAFKKSSPVHDQQRIGVLRQKERVWRYQGLLTHSDTHYLAYRIMYNSVREDKIASLIARRFPVILVDEYQDTNYFLALTLQKLFAQPCVRGLIVGDTDQAIYEFGGAHPRLFDDLETQPGAKTFPLRRTFRCPINVAKIAVHLAHSHNPVVPTREQGHTILVAHGGNPQVLNDIITTCHQPGDRIAVLARRLDTIDTLHGRERPKFPGGCKLAEQLQYATSILPTSARKAGRITSAALANVLLDDFYPTKIILEEHKITQREWRRAVWYLLTCAAKTREGETWQDWVQGLRQGLAETAKIVHQPLEQRKIGNCLRINENMRVPRQTLAPVQPAPWPKETLFSTVHGVKGEEFETVAFYSPKPSQRGTGAVAKEWWNQAEPEERRIAFVATTRAKRLFILCVDKKTYWDLQNEQPEFFASFAQHEAI
jgi:DNA helicase II / ATP-dependent DNA helicase PcrA